MKARLPAYGRAPSFSPPYGAGASGVVYCEALGESFRTPAPSLPESATERPTALWGSLLQSGYRVVYADVYEGIPIIAAERDLWTTRGVQVAAPSSDYVMSYALVVEGGDDQQCNRGEGLASGRALDLLWGRQGLRDDYYSATLDQTISVGRALFSRPTLIATLNGTLSDPADDTIVVDSTAGWPSQGGFFLGREWITYTSTTSTIFGGCRRGVCGYPYHHTASTMGAFAQCSDTPIYWRGRFVTRWEHLCTPDGRFLGERWCTLGEYCRQAWRGFVRDAPRPEHGGMVVTALPLVRLADQEFGAEIHGKMRPDMIVSEASDTVDITTMVGGVSAEYPKNPITTNQGIISILAWAGIVAGQFTADGLDLMSVIVRDDRIEFRARNGAWVTPNAWFLDNARVSGADGSRFAWNTGGGLSAGAWIVCEIEPQSDYSDAVIGASGLIVIEVAGRSEIASYDTVRTSNDGRLTAFRLSMRNLFGTGSFDVLPNNAPTDANPWRNDSTVRVLTGTVANWPDALRVLLTSSGTGARGDYDMLPAGFGLGVPDDWISVPPVGRGDFSSLGEVAPTGGMWSGMGPIVAATTGRTSIKDILCGWLVLKRACLVQKRQADGTITIDIAETDVVDDAGATAITSFDVLLDGHDVPELIEAPNHIKITASDLITERPTFVVRDPQRAQSEGVRSLDVKAPGATNDIAIQLAGELLLMGDGQAAIKMRLAPWVDIEIGDVREIDTAHPVIWDWGDGSFAPASVMGRVVGIARDFVTLVQEVTFLLAAQARERIYLAPCARVLQVEPGLRRVYRVEAGGATGFAIGDGIAFYRRGDDASIPLTHAANITAIVEGIGYDTITIDTNPGSYVESGEVIMTFADYASCTIRQQSMMYAGRSKYFR